MSTLCLRASAGSVGPPIAELLHTHWNASDGAPTITSIVQGEDGFLWLGTDHGLFFFDGITFRALRMPEQREVLSRQISVVAAAPGGGLWIGYELGGASFLKDGHLRTYDGTDGLSAGCVRAFAFGSNGDVWAATQYGLVRFSGSRWTDVGTHWSYPHEYPDNLFMDSRGTLWTSTRTGLSALKRGEKSFQLVDSKRLANVDFSEDPNGTLWLASATGAVRAITTSAGDYLPDGVSYSFKSEGIHVDRDGALWITTVDEGLVRIALPENRSNGHPRKSDFEHFEVEDGLTSDYSFDVIEGREGETWVATAKGLDQFRRAPFKPVKLLPGSTYIAMVTDQAGELLIASDKLSRVQTDLAIPITGAPSNIECVYRDPFGNVWMGSPEGLWKYKGFRFEALHVPPPFDRNQHVIQAMTLDGERSLWVSYLQDGVFRLKDGHWEHLGGIPDLSDDPAISMFTDSKEVLWFGYLHDRVARITGHTQELFGQEQGLRVGMVSTITEASNRIWVGGDAGLQFADRGRFWFLKISGLDGLRGVSGIVTDSRGDLWLNTADGVFDVPKRELAQALADPSYAVQAVHLSYLDGLTGNPDSLHHLPTALRANDGRLYFAIQGSVVRLDPDTLSKNLLPPPILILSATADGETYSDALSISIPARTRSLIIDYTAGSLLIPQRVHFRYKLDGIDTAWQDAGTRREALYSRLPPGRYQFHVIASNNDNIWNESGATLAIEMPPAFTQSVGFLALCGVVVAMGLWFIYWVRLRQATENIKSHLYARVSERERIARDLHDTFLQGVQGLLLSFYTATKHMNGDERSKVLLDSAFVQSDVVMQEGRALILNLRGEAAEVDDLSRALCVAGQHLAKDHTSTFALTVTGRIYALHPVMRDEIFRIAREAIANAFTHAVAKAIEVDLVYGETNLVVRIRDNGVGIDPSIVTAGFREKHWGLPGMRERARSIGAELDLWSQLRAGTELEVRIPVRLASSIPRSKHPPLLAPERFGEHSG